MEYRWRLKTKANGSMKPDLLCVDIAEWLLGGSREFWPLLDVAWLLVVIRLASLRIQNAQAAT